MKYFIDSNIWVAAFNRKDTNHTISKEIVNNIAEGNMGIVFINNHVFDEIVTYVRKKLGEEQSLRVTEAIINSPHVQLLYVDELVFNASYHIFQMFESISFTDASIIVMMKNNNIRYLYSFNSDFDRIKDIIRLDNYLPDEKMNK